MKKKAVKAPSKPKKQKIQVKEADGKVKVIGEYDPNTRFSLVREEEVNT